MADGPVAVGALIVTGRPRTRTGSPDEAAVWPLFVGASLGVATTAGFGLGGALFAVTALGWPIGRWWPAAAQAHGHVQLFGWAGLMVLGVGFHFLPRLAGGPRIPTRAARVVLGLLLTGLVARVLFQPSLAATPTGPMAPVLGGGLVASGALELAGATLALGLLVRTMRAVSAVRPIADFRSVLPFFAIAFAAFWLALGANLAGLAGAASAGNALVPHAVDRLTTQLGFHGFLVPVSVAMSARTFPLYLRTRPPKSGPLRFGLALLLAGLALRIAGEVGTAPTIGGLGALAQAAALGAFVLALGVFAPRRPLPRRPVRPLTDPIQLHALTAYLWLLVAAALLAQSGMAAAAAGATAVRSDAEWHALGAGFVTLLILGVGAHLLPGFARRPVRGQGLIWLTLVLGNAAAILRLGPVLFASRLPTALAGHLLAAAGLAGLLAVAAFGINVTGAEVPQSLRPRATRGTSAVVKE